jgi:predicted nuclease of restriction endonuclease-like (RecB) superfamily
MAKFALDKTYINWLKELKTKIATTQIKAAIAVHQALILLYFDMGKMIVERQANTNWGDALIQQVAKDLKTEFPDVAGFSRSNLYAMKQFYLFYKDTPEFVHQVGGQIPWRHHVLILQKTKRIEVAIFYIRATLENNWSRNILSIQIETNLYERQGAAIHNFERTLPAPQSDLARETLKDPYIFDFLTLEKNIQEVDFERQLVAHITQFLLELGKGFAFIGRQYEIKVGKKDYRIDLLFYHTKLHAYIVLELKMGEFQPEYIGKLNFYLSAVDDMLKSSNDQPTIGILLCKNKDKIEVEYALRDIHKPIGVSEFRFNELPDNIKSLMPTVTELENELFGFNNMRSVGDDR